MAGSLVLLAVHDSVTAQHPTAGQLVMGRQAHDAPAVGGRRTVLAPAPRPALAPAPARPTGPAPTSALTGSSAERLAALQMQSWEATEQELQKALERWRLSPAEAKRIGVPRLSGARRGREDTSTAAGRVGRHGGCSQQLTHITLCVPTHPPLDLPTTTGKMSICISPYTPDVRGRVHASPGGERRLYTSLCWERLCSIMQYPAACSLPANPCGPGGERCSLRPAT